jgi:beta-lactamase regulating signal transducer with metallopeptidase domain
MMLAEWLGNLARRSVDIPPLVWMLIQFTALFAAAWVAHAALARANPRWRVLLWRGTGIAVLLLPIWVGFGPLLTVPVDARQAVSEIDPAMREPVSAPARASDDVVSDESTTGSPADPEPPRSSGKPMDGAFQRSASAGTAGSRREAAQTETPIDQFGAPLQQSKVRWPVAGGIWLAAVWFLGFVVFTSRTLLGHRRVGRILAEATSPPSRVADILARVARELPARSSVQLLSSVETRIPFLCGLRRACIILPEKFCSPRYAEDLPAIFAHELSHAESHDLVWNALLHLEAAVFWFHPLAWRMPAAHAAGCESVGDAVSATYVGGAATYSRTLARVALEVLSRPASAVMAMARTTDLSGRLDALEKAFPHRTVSCRAMIVAAIVSCGAIALVASLRPVHAAPSEGKTPEATVAGEPPAAKQTAEGPETPAAKSPALARVFGAWKARQERVKSFHVRWDLRIVRPQGYEVPAWAGLAGVTMGRVESGRDKEVAFTVRQLEWCGEGVDRLRSDFGEFVYGGAGGWKETGRFRLTHDGSLNSRLYVPVGSAKVPTMAIWRHVPVKSPSAWSSSGDFLLKARDVDLGPLRFAVRPLGPNSDWSPENCRVIREDELVGNVRCIKLQMDKVDHSERCWVDPSRDCSVVRWERRQGNAPPLDVTIGLEQSHGHEWLPARWEWRLARNAMSRPALFEATVTGCTINEKLPEATFAPASPAGSRVYDATVDLPIFDGDDPAGVQSPNEARATLNAIADAWLKRQGTIKTLMFTWERDGELKGRETIHSVCLDGEKFSTAFATPGWVPSPAIATTQREWTVNQMKQSFDGVTSYRLSFSDRGPLVSITSGFGKHGAGLPGDRDLMLVFRPLHAKFGRINPTELRDPSKFRVVAGRRKIGNIACVVIETELNPGMHISYWLDPARDYLPLRAHRTLNGEDRERVDIFYRVDPTFGSIPVGWKEASVGLGGALLGSATDTVTSFSINQPIPESEFEVETPPGAEINDSRIDGRSEREKAEDTTRKAKIAAIMAAREARRKATPGAKPKAVYDPFADAVADVEAALKAAKASNRRVLIEFGANWCVGCRDLSVVLKENAAVSTVLNRSFVLVLVDTQSETGRKIHEKYVPGGQRNSIPHLAVLDSTGQVLTNNNTREIEDGEDYAPAKIQTFLARWSPSK